MFFPALRLPLYPRPQERPSHPQTTFVGALNPDFADEDVHLAITEGREDEPSRNLIWAQVPKLAKKNEITPDPTFNRLHSDLESPPPRTDCLFLIAKNLRNRDHTLTIRDHPSIDNFVKSRVRSVGQNIPRLYLKRTDPSIVFETNLLKLVKTSETS